MTGLSILAALTLYGWISFGAVWLVVKSAKKRGRSPVRWGILAGLVMYHLVFWDLIPTLVVYKYYCATKAGFWVYKTPEQWKAENPGVAETLTWRERSERYTASGIIDGYRLNQRFAWVMVKQDAWLIPLSLVHETIVDTVTHEVLVKRISVGVGYPKGLFISSLRLWKWEQPYLPNIKEFGNLERNFKEMGGREK